MSALPRYPKTRSWRAIGPGLLAAAVTFAAQGGERGPAAPLASATTAAAAPAEARVIVKYKADSSLMRVLSASNGATATGASAATAATTQALAVPRHAQALGARLGLALTDGLPLGPMSQVVRATGITAADLASRLAVQADVEYAVVDQRVRIATVPNDAYFAAQTLPSFTPAAGQWYLRTPTGDGQVASINMPVAWDLSIGSSSVVVAVIDTGITSHPDLVGKVLPGYDFISDSGTAADGDGRDADPTDPGDGVQSGQVGSITGCTTGDVGSSSWHGTQTAGLIGAATNNGVGMAGAGWNVMLLPLRALGKCGGSESDVVAAIRWAAGGSVPGVPANGQPARVINLSLGGTSGVACDTAYQDAINYAVGQGVVVVAAAGNDGLALGAPANCSGVISVAGVRHVGTKVGYSDLGSTVTIAAPAGNCVNATGQTCLYPLLTTSNDGQYTVGNPVYTDGDIRPSLGTSFSAPLVAGTVALMRSANPALTPSQIATMIQNTARPFPVSGSPPLVSATSSSVATGASVGLTGTPVAVCTAPGATAQSTECYCTTSTCGRGLLDAGGAVTAAAGLPPLVYPPAAAAAPVVAYQWAIAGTTGSASATFSGSTSQATATVVAGGVGTFTASLTTTDALNQTRVASTTVTVAAPVATPTPTPAPAPTPVTGTSTSNSSSSGGGAVSYGWLSGLLGAGVALRVVRPSDDKAPPRRA